jgi:hypothetical protein
MKLLSAYLMWKIVQEEKKNIFCYWKFFFGEIFLTKFFLNKISELKFLKKVFITKTTPKNFLFTKNSKIYLKKLN